LAFFAAPITPLIWKSPCSAFLVGCKTTGLSAMPAAAKAAAASRSTV